MISIMGLVCCLEPDLMSLAQVTLFSELGKRGGVCEIIDVEVTPHESTEFESAEQKTNLWVFTYFVDDSSFEKVIEKTLDSLRFKGVVYSYIIDHHVPENIISQN